MNDGLFWIAIVGLPLLAAGLLLRWPRRDRVASDTGAGLPQIDPPCHHVVPGDVAEFVIPDFRPGTDTCRIHLHDPEAEFDAVIDEGGVRFQFLDGNSFLEVVFPGLRAPPFSSTRIVGPSPSQAETVLSDLVGPGPPVQSAHFHRVRSEIAAFQRFSADDEVVEVWVPPGTDALPRIDVRPSSDGSDGEVVIDGRPAARLCGAPEAGVRNIRIIRKSPDDLLANDRLSA